MDTNSKYMQEKTINRQQMQTILDQAPQGVDKKALIDKFVSNGFTVEGVNDKKEPNIAQTIGGTLIKAPTDLIGTGFAGVGALGAYAGKKLAGQDTTLSQEYANQTQQVQQSGANTIIQQLTGQEIRPAQNMEQLAGDVLQTGALAAPGVGLVKGSTTGAALMGGQAMSENQSAFDVGKNILLGAGIGGTLGVAVPAVEKLISATPKIASKAGKVVSTLKPDPASIMQRVLRVTKGQQAKFEQNYGTSIGQYAVDRGLIGTQEEVANNLANRFTTSIKAADDALATLPGKYQPEVVKTALQDLYEKKLATSAKGATDPEMNAVKELLNKFDNVGLDMSEINQAKRLYERNVKLDFVKTNNPEGVKLANNIDQAIREWQFGQAERLGLKNLPEINKETRMAKELLNSLEREASGKAGNNAISLTDWIVLADGGVSNMAAFLAKKGFSSDTAQAFVAKYFAPKAKVGLPTAEMGTPQIDATVQSYFDFLKKTGTISQDTGKKLSPQIKQKVFPLTESIPQTTKGASKKILGGSAGTGVVISDAGAAPESFPTQTPTSIDMIDDIKYVLSHTENSGKMNYSQMDKETGKTAIGPYQITKDMFTAVKKQNPNDFIKYSKWEKIKGNKEIQEMIVDRVLNNLLDRESPYTLEQIFAIWRKGIGKASTSTGINYSNKAMKIYNDKFKTLNIGSLQEEIPGATKI